MRVISGKSRGVRLLSPYGDSVRPTSDRVKEAIFNIIADHVPGARVLDLFGGSGALAIEAVSRGAKSAVIVDSDARSIDIIKKNVALSRAGGEIEVIKSDFEAYLKRGAGPFDIVFLDPPYNMELIPRALYLLKSCGSVAHCGIIVCESDRGEELPAGDGPFTLGRSYRYGRTFITVYQNSGPL